MIFPFARSYLCYAPQETISCPKSERSEDIVCGIAADIVHAQRGFCRCRRGDFVNRFTQSKPLPIDWEEDIQLPTGNDIRFADEILPGRQDEIGMHIKLAMHFRKFLRFAQPWT